jgi:hypothetical protein
MTEPGSSTQERQRRGFHEAVSVDGLYEAVVTVSTIRLGALTGPRGAWRFEPVPEGALALLRQVSGAEPAPLVAARAGESGLLYALDPADRSSRSSEMVLRLRAPAHYQLWWTLDESLFADALEDPSALDSEGTLIVVQQRVPYDSDGPLWEELTELKVAQSVRHVVCHHLLHRHAFHETPASPIFDVTPASVRALFTAEFMQWYVNIAQEASGNHLATLQHAAAMIEAAEKGHKDTSFERRAAKLFPSASERRVFDYFRDYAWRCAATGVDPRRFATSIAMTGPSELPPGGLPEESAADAGVPQQESSWLTAAVEVRETTVGKKHGPAVHPHLQGVTGPVRVLAPDGVILTPQQQQLLFDYYENYLFGATLRNTWIDGGDGFDGPTHYRGRMAARTEDWVRKQDEVRERARTLLTSQAPPHRFLGAVAACYPDDDELIDRYVETAANCGLAWWRQLARAEARSAPPRAADGRFVTAPWPFWKTLKARLKPLAELAKASGKISGLASRYLTAYDLAREDATELLDTLSRLEVTLAGGDVDATRHFVRSGRASVSMDPGADAGQVQIRLSGARPPGAPASVSLRFVRETATVHPRGVPDPSSGASATRSFEPWSRPGTRHVVVPADLDDLRALSKLGTSFSALAESLNLAIAIATLCGDAKAQDKAFATFDLTKSIVGVVPSVPGALIALVPALERQELASRLVKGAESQVKNLSGLSTWLSRFDGAFKIYKGFDTLFSPESDLQYELRHERTFRATLQRFNGVANIVAGAASAVELVGVGVAAAGASQVLGFSTALLVGFSATPWGLVFALGGGILVAGSALVLDLAQPWDKKLLEIERALDAACREEIRRERFTMSLRLDALLTAVS